MRKNFNLDRANRRFFMCATKPHFNSNKSHKTFRKHTISSHWELDNGKMVFSFFFFDIFEWMWIDNEPQDSRHCLSLKRLGRLLKTATHKKTNQTNHTIPKRSLIPMELMMIITSLCFWFSARMAFACK